MNNQKTTKEVQIAFRCDPQFRERCRKVAALDGRDVSNWILWVLAQEMDRVEGHMVAVRT